MNAKMDKYSKGKAGRHETFVPRYGWLTKGYAKCVENPRIFSDKNAIEQLGVGKNMVRSIRFWCLLMKLLKEPDKKAGIKGQLLPTKLGICLIGKPTSENNTVDFSTGWDPFLEDIASLWLLHWQIFSPPFSAVSWPLAFNFCSLQTFSPHDLRDSIINKANDDSRLATISPNSYEKDASCIIRMYAQSTKRDHEIRCPFNMLGLLESATINGHFRFAIGRRTTLPPLIFLAACFSYADSLGSTAQTISLNDLAYGWDSPGVVFKIPETECGRLLERAIKNFQGVSFIESAGRRQLHFKDKPLELYWACLKKYYKENA